MKRMNQGAQFVPEHHQSILTLMISNLIYIPEFEGKLNPEEFLDWLSAVERVVKYKDVPEDKKSSS